MMMTWVEFFSNGFESFSNKLEIVDLTIDTKLSQSCAFFMILFYKYVNNFGTCLREQVHPTTTTWA